MHIPELDTLARLFQSRGAALYAVGGMVRNPLLGLPVSDMDVCSRLTPDEVKALAERQGIKHVDTGAAFGMVELHMNGQVFQHTTFRSDSYPEGGGHRPYAVRFSQSLEEDAFRRDFTVNAIYKDLTTGEVKDPTGGMGDIRRRLIRATSKDPSVIMGDDALRILRMVRFSAELGFDIDPATFFAATSCIDGLRDISVERIREELDKILLSDARYGNAGAVYPALERLDRLGAIEVIFPELARGRGIEQKPEYHKYDVLHHAFHTADCIEPALTLRLAALLHDVGKPDSFASTGKMYIHDSIGEGMAAEMLTRLKYPAAAVKEVSQLVRHHMYDLRSEAKESTLRVWLQQRGRTRSRRLIALRRADVWGSGRIQGSVKSADRWEQILDKMEKEGVPFEERELDITGTQLMAALGIPPGPKVGNVKKGLMAHCARHPGDNRRDKLLKIAGDLVNNS